MFSKNLKKIMEQKGITCTALAKKTGYSKGAVSQWMNGVYTPSYERMGVIAAALGCTVDELAGTVKEAGSVTTTGPTAAPEQKTVLTCKEAATLMHKHESYVRQGLQEGRPGFEFGSAVKTSGKWSYFISAAKFTEVTGIPAII